MRKLYAIIGCLFLVVSALIYTSERAFLFMATSLQLAGFLSGGVGGTVPQIKVAGFFDNFFSPLFLVLGLLSFTLFLFSSFKKD